MNCLQAELLPPEGFIALTHMTVGLRVQPKAMIRLQLISLTMSGSSVVLYCRQVKFRAPIRQKLLQQGLGVLYLI